MRITTEKEQAGEEFDHQISWRDGCFAGAALSPQNQPAQHGHIMVERDEVSAVRAGGARGYDRLAERQPVNTHVQEAAKAQPQSEDRNCKSNFHLTRIHMG